MANEDETAVDQTVAEKAAPKQKAPFHYIVREPFGDYRKGQLLTSALLIAGAHKEGHAHKLIRVGADPSLEA